MRCCIRLTDPPTVCVPLQRLKSHRTKVSTKFRDGRNMIMFTSDVSARGMDYPDISTVIQVRITPTLRGGLLVKQTL